MSGECAVSGVTSQILCFVRNMRDGKVSNAVERSFDAIVACAIEIRATRYDGQVEVLGIPNPQF